MNKLLCGAAWSFVAAAGVTLLVGFVSAFTEEKYRGMMYEPHSVFHWPQFAAALAVAAVCLLAAVVIYGIALIEVNTRQRPPAG